MKFQFEAVATVRNARTTISDDDWGNVVSEIVLDDRFTAEALEGIEGFSHLEIIYAFHLLEDAPVCEGARHPRGNKAWPLTGIFAQRAKDRPNKIGLCTVELISRKDRILRVRGLDAVNGTPVLDIKPLMREFLPRTAVRQPEWVSELMKQYWTKNDDNDRS